MIGEEVGKDLNDPMTLILTLISGIGGYNSFYVTTIFSLSYLFTAEHTVGILQADSSSLDYCISFTFKSMKLPRQRNYSLFPHLIFIPDILKHCQNFLAVFPGDTWTHDLSIS